MQKRSRREFGLLGLKLSKPTNPDFGKARGSLCFEPTPRASIAPEQDASIYSTKVLAGGCLLLLLHRKSRSSALPNRRRKVLPGLPVTAICNNPLQHPAPSTKAPAHACLNDADLSAGLRLTRAGLNLVPSHFTKVSKLSIRTVQMIEARAPDPRASTLRKIAGVLHHHGVSVWRDETGAIGVTCSKAERKMVVIREARNGCLGS